MTPGIAVDCVFKNNTENWRLVMLHKKKTNFVCFD